MAFRRGPGVLTFAMMLFRHAQIFEVDLVERVEPDTLLFLRRASVSLVARIVSDEDELEAGRTVHLEFPPEHHHWFSGRGGERLG